MPVEVLAGPVVAHGGSRVGVAGGDLEPAGGGVPVHPHAEGVAQERPAGAVVDGPVDGSGHRRWQRDEHDLAALAAHA